MAVFNPRTPKFRILVTNKGPYIYDVHPGGGREGRLKNVTKSDGKLGGGGGVKKKLQNLGVLGSKMTILEPKT